MSRAFSLTIGNLVSSWDFVHRSRGSIHGIGDRRRPPLLLDARTSLLSIAEGHERARLMFRQSISVNRRKLPIHTSEFTRSMAYRLGIHKMLTCTCL